MRFPIFIFLASLTCLMPLAAHKSDCSSKRCRSIAKLHNQEFDYIIVGGGTAGCALAAKLSDPDPRTGKFKNSVLVIEAGANLTKDPNVLNNNLFAAGALTFDPKYSKVYSVYSTDTIPAVYTDGRMLGGSSAHNGLQAYRGSPDVYNQWAQITGDDRWSYNQLLKHDMLKMEHYTPNGTPLNPAQRGTNGPLFITQEPPLDNDPFMIAFSEGTNTPFVPDLNDPTYGDIGVGANQNWVTPPYLGPNSIRSFSANSYLTGIPSEGIPAIINQKGFGLDGRKLRVVFNATVNRILFNKHNVAKKVEFILNDDTETVLRIKPRKEVILCAGTIVDAVILQRSGVGDPKLLKSLGIPVVFDNPNVGANMQNHYGPTGVISGSTIPLPRIGNAFMDLSPFMPAGVRRYQALIINSPAFLPAGIRTALGITSGVTVAAVDVTPKSLGTVKIVSRDPFIEPRIDLNVYSDGPVNEPGTDAYEAVSFYKLLQNIADAAGETVLFPPPADYVAGDEALLNDAFNTLLIAYHDSGTCRMALSPETGVIDGKLRVFGVKKVRVASCASAPVIETGNTAYQAYVIGLEAARIIRKKDQR
jgi:choline dehydrogenase